MNAFQKNFTDATLSRCYLHFCRSFVRTIIEVALKSIHEHRTGLVLSFRMIPTLSFFPLEEIKPAFDLIVEETTGDVEFSSLEDRGRCAGKNDLLAYYFQKTYIGYVIGSTYRPQFFNLQIGIQQWQQQMALSDRILPERAGILDYKRYSRDLILTFGFFFGSLEKTL